MARKARVLSSSGQMASITVEDDGVGFPPDLLESAVPVDQGKGTTPLLFQRFVKGSESKGHGLGLAFVHAVARAHGGRVVARNRGLNGSSGAGAQVVFELPPCR